MFWLARPPRWRRAAAAAVVLIAAYMDLSGPVTEQYPFAAAATARGEAIALRWKQVPRGLLPPAGNLKGVAAHDLVAGAPLVVGAVAAEATVPDGWWALPAELPIAAVPGSEVLVAARAPELQVAGIVVAPASAGSFGTVSAGMVAIPPEHAAAVAAALAEHRATILVRP